MEAFTYEQEFVARPDAFGILYAEDFGVSLEVPPRAPPPPPPVRTLMQADVDAACIQAVAAAQLAWEREAAAEAGAALSSIGAGLQAMRAEAEAGAAEMAETLARTVLAQLQAMLPALCQTHGDREVQAMTRHLVRLLAREARVVVRVHAGLVDALQSALATEAEAVSDTLTIEVRPANLPAGDVRVSWQDGGLRHDTAAVRATLAEHLAQLGLGPLETDQQQTTGVLDHAL